MNSSAMNSSAMKHLASFTLLLATHSAVAEDHGLFESKVRPVLVEHCYECHSGERTKGGLALDTKRGWEMGGDSGPAIARCTTCWTAAEPAAGWHANKSGSAPSVTAMTRESPAASKARSCSATAPASTSSRARC